jgi:hypothetical protein
LFDTVWRKGLWHELLGNEINGKMYKVIFNMHSGIKSRVLYNGEMSEYFPCNIGVRQRENLAPFLFSIYLNDLQQFLEERKYNFRFARINFKFPDVTVLTKNI